MRPFIALCGWMAVFIAISLASNMEASACGIDWSKPQTHFDGVDPQGHVMFVDSLGNLTLKDGTTTSLLPHMHFRMAFFMALIPSLMDRGLTIFCLP